MSTSKTHWLQFIAVLGVAGFDEDAARIMFNDVDTDQVGELSRFNVDQRCHIKEIGAQQCMAIV